MSCSQTVINTDDLYMVSTEVFYLCIKEYRILVALLIMEVTQKQIGKEIHTKTYIHNDVVEDL